jgi:hypothetical protein
LSNPWFQNGMEAVPYGLENCLMEWIAAIGFPVLLGCIALTPYLLGPLLVYLTFRHNTQPRIRVFQPGAEPLPPDVEQFLSSTAWALASEGFEIHSALQAAEMIPNATLTVLVMVNRQACDMALVTAVEVGGKRVMFVGIAAKTRDGRGLLVNNSPVLPAFPIPEQVEMLVLPNVRDAQRLYRIHAGLSALRGMVGHKVLRIDAFGGDAVKFFLADLAEEVQHAARAGLVRWNESARVWRATPRGAFYFAWNELYPWKGWRRRQQKKRARAALDELTDAAQREAEPIMATLR